MLDYLKVAPAVLLMTVASAPATAQVAGDPEQGKRLYGRCVTCHTLEEGKHRVGPSLFRIFGAPAAAAKGFPYSVSLMAAGKQGLKWDAAALSAYMEDPLAFTRSYLKDPKATSKMAFRVPDEKQRLDIVAYLRSRTESQAPKGSGSGGN
jgi:cytochrome c